MCSTPPRRGKSSARSMCASKRGAAASPTRVAIAVRAKTFACAWLLSSAAFATGTEFTTPHRDDAAGAQSVSFAGQTFVNHGLVGTGRLSAQTVDFLGDTLGSFSSLGVDKASWRRVGDHYEGVLWTLPDRGRNDPGAGLFYDYAARLHRFRIRFTPYTGRPLPADVASQNQMRLVPDGGRELRDVRGTPFTGADPGAATKNIGGTLFPVPAQGVGAGKIAIDSESLSFAADGSFYIGDEYAAYVYLFDGSGRMRGALVPPNAVVPHTAGKINFNSLAPPDSGRRNNQGVEGMSLSPDGTRLFVALQSALVQDTARAGDKRDASGRVTLRVLVYDTAQRALPTAPIAHYVMQLPAYTSDGDGGRVNRTAAQSEIRALNAHQFLMLARDANGLGADNEKPIVYKSVLLADTEGATNLAGGVYETGTESVLRAQDDTALKPGIEPIRWTELVDLLNPTQLARFGLNLETKPKNRPLTLSEKWEAMDLVSVLDPAHPDDYFLIVGNDNDFIARRCVMQKQRCDSEFDNDNMLLVYRLTLPGMQAYATRKR